MWCNFLYCPPLKGCEVLHLGLTLLKKIIAYLATNVVTLLDVQKDLTPVFRAHVTLFDDWREIETEKEEGKKRSYTVH